MSDRYAKLVNAPGISQIAGQLGLPRPVTLERRDGGPLVKGKVLSGAAPGGRLERPLKAALDAIAVERAGAEGPAKALVFDASGIADSTELVELQRFFYPAVGRLERNGRVVVLGTPPADAGSSRAATAQRALEGFTRSLGKEVGGRGATAQLVLVSEGGEGQLESTLRFLLSPRSAYVSGQVVRVGKGVAPLPEIDWDRPLDGKVALVTGASRGIGAAIAETLAADGARIVGLDVPQAAESLQGVVEKVGGANPIELDITEPDAPARIAERFSDGHVDVVVHNAGVTRDRTIAKMPEDRWSELMEINLSSEERINDALLEAGLLASNGRIVCVSSMSGIAGNSGQTNYATSKAGVIGMVEALAPELAGREATINAVAPGFIETQMTAAMPIGPREAGRRMSSLSQGGLPVDVAETIAWFASPGLDRGQRQRGPGLRPEPAGGVMRTRALDNSPSILPLYARAAAPLIPGASLLPFVPGGGGEIPELELTLAGVRAEPDAVAAYDRVCGFPLRDDLPPTYPHVLAFPLHMAVMADGSFPFGAVGLVHLENRIAQRRPIGIDEELSLTVRPTALQPHPKGSTFSLVTEARAGEELVWESTSTILRRGGGSSESRSYGERTPDGRRFHAHRRVGPGRRPRTPLCGGVGGPEPDPHALADREAARLPGGDRPRDVDEGPLPGGAREPASRRLRGRGRLPPPDPAAGDGSSSAAARRVQEGSSSSSETRRRRHHHLEGSVK